MKNFILSVLLMSLNVVFASEKCDKKVYQDYKNFIESETEYVFDGLIRIGQEYAEYSINNSTELNNEEMEQALIDIQKVNVLLYEAATTYMSGAGLELLIVNPESCEIEKKIFWYAE
jgi:hypothetical protein